MPRFLNRSTSCLFRSLFCLFLTVSIISGSVSVSQNAETYRIDRVKDNVYRFTSGHYRSVFMVCEDEIIVTDPISEEAATWLKTELSKQFEKPIGVVIYSHSHPDHASGGNAFDGPGVKFISHELARMGLEMSKVQTKLPDITFQNNLTVRSGESRVTLRYHGPNNGMGSISMLFEPAGVLHVVDWVQINRMPYKNLQGYHLTGMIHSIPEVLDLDFEIFVGGHGENGTRAEIERYLSYLEKLHDSVRDGMLAGKNVKQLKK